MKITLPRISLVFRNWLYKLMGASINFSCGLNNKAVNNMVSHDSSDYVLGTCNGASAAILDPADVRTVFQMQMQ